LGHKFLFIFTWSVFTTSLEPILSKIRDEANGARAERVVALN